MTGTPQTATSRHHATSERVPLEQTLRLLLAINPADLTTALDEAATAIGRALQADTATVLLHDARTDRLVIRGTWASSWHHQREISGFDGLPIGLGGLAVKTFTSGDGYLNGDVGRDADSREGLARAFGTSSAVMCRLEVEEVALGVLALTSTHRHWFTTEDLEFLECVRPWVTLIARATSASAADAGMTSDRRSAAAAQLQHLTPREREVSALVASGLTNQEIAERLTVVPGTVSNHIEHILRKLGFSRRVQIATWSVLCGLWELDTDCCRSD